MHTSPVLWVPSLQPVPSGSLLARQVPLPLQVSRLSQAPLAGLPQAVPLSAEGCVQVPAPAHSSLVHWLVHTHGR